MPAERPGLLQRTKELIRPTHRFDDPAYRKDLALRMGIELEGDLPECLNGSCVVLCNYIGREGLEGDKHKRTKPYLDPTIRAFVYFSYLASLNGKKNRVIGVGRPNAKEAIHDPELARAAFPFLVLTKKEGDRYQLGRKGLVRIGKHLKSDGVFCATPAATTRDRGYRLDLKTGITRLALANEYNLAVLAIATSGQAGQELIPVAISSKQVMPPAIIYQGGRQSEREHYREAYYAITLYAMGLSASLVPAVQRGEFEEPEKIMERGKTILRGLRFHGLSATGGFLDQA